MTYTKKEFGLELKAQLLQGNNCNKISKWAFKIYIDQGLACEKGVFDFSIFSTPSIIAAIRTKKHMLQLIPPASFSRRGKLYLRSQWQSP